MAHTTQRSGPDEAAVSPAPELVVAAFDAVGSAAAVLDEDGAILATNRSWRLFSAMNGGDASATGTGANYLAACRRAGDRGVEEAARVVRGLEGLLDGEVASFDLEYPCPSPDEDRWFQLQATPLVHAGRRHVVVLHTNITRRKQLEARLSFEAVHDPLTGLPNRRALSSHLRELQPHAFPAAVLVADLDGFKAVNDAHGHGVGDELLVVVGSRIVRQLRPDDVVARVGGDEFVAVCAGVGELAVATAIARRLEEVLGEPFQIGSQRLEVGGTVGVSILRDQRDADAAIDRADHAMYRRKGAKRAEGR